MTLTKQDTHSSTMRATHSLQGMPRSGQVDSSRSSIMSNRPIKEVNSNNHSYNPIQFLMEVRLTNKTSPSKNVLLP